MCLDHARLLAVRQATLFVCHFNTLPCCTVAGAEIGCRAENAVSKKITGDVASQAGWCRGMQRWECMGPTDSEGTWR